MEQVANIMFNNGVGIACLLYMMYFMQTTMKDMQKTMEEVQKVLISLQTKIDSLERK